MTGRFAAVVLLALTTAAAAESVDVREGLTLPGARRGRRQAIPGDPIVARIVAGTWAMPKAGEAADLGDGRDREWQRVEAQAEGFRAPPGSYLAIEAASDADRVMVLEASGHGAVHVGDEPRVGDPYATGYVRLPVRLRKGSTPLLFLGGRGGSIPVKLTAPKAPALLNAGDLTTPDLVRGEPLESPGSIVVLNATDAPLDGVKIVSRVGDGPEIASDVGRLPPLAAAKVGFAIKAGPREGDGDSSLAVRLVAADGSTLDSATVSLRVREPGEAIKRTFVSAIDGSVQYYGWIPAAPEDGGGRPGLILTLHGASVEAIGQAAAYRPKPGLHIVAPTNRRPYGFDWEDWGRKDAIEVLDRASASLDGDPARVYLTGHSMGGHGTWHVGVTHPYRFAAIAPSAGWVSMFSYAGASRAEALDPVDALIARATNPSDTLALVRNLAGLGVYVLHGDADDNVPVTQARIMREQLGAFHPDFAYHERPGAGHWWGDECVDWPPLMAFLRERRLRPADEIRRVDFITMNPAIASRSAWATIEAQSTALKPSAVHLDRDADRKRVEGTTENVARLALDAAGERLDVSIDGQDLPELTPVATTEGPRVVLRRTRDGAWSAGPAAPPGSKGPRRSGPFKEAFDRGFILVYGTAGTTEENAWSLARARCDAETFWYRGNGSPAVVADVEFLDPVRRDEFADRGVILYGNASTNAAWGPLLGDGPVRVDRGSIRVGDREVKGDDLACLFARPRPGSDVAMVAAISGTGPVGMRLTATLPYFTSGVAYPDLTVVRAGNPAPRAVAAGYFGEDWGVESGEFAWRD
jgi:poly(3-hydroxybutyrate) depolymerase